MNSQFINNNSIYSNIELTKTKFIEFYRDEIQELFNLICSELNKKNIRILSHHTFYYDFVDFIYRFSIKKLPKI